MNAVDTNVLVYAYGVSAPAKRDAAQKLIVSLSDGVLLWQVACEFVSAARKTVVPGGDATAAWDRLDDIRRLLRLVVPREGSLARAREIQVRTRAQFWDCLIFGACLEAGVTRLYSEDLPGGVVPGLEIVNPFI